MARIRFIKKNAERILEDTFVDFETQLDSSNLPAYITCNNGDGKDVLKLSYTGSTESVREVALGNGIDVSIGSRSGRIVKVEGRDIFRHVDEILTIDTDTDRARNNLEGGVGLIRELEEERR